MMKAIHIFSLSLALAACPVLAQAQAYIEKSVSYDPNSHQYLASVGAYVTGGIPTSNPVDILLVVESYKIHDNIGQLDAFIDNLPNILNENSTRVGVVSYGEEADVVLGLTELKNLKDYSLPDKNDSRWKYDDTWASVDKGLSKAKDVLDAAAIDGTKYATGNKYLVLIMGNKPRIKNTDGQSPRIIRDATASAYALKNTNNVTIYSIGVDVTESNRMSLFTIDGTFTTVYLYWSELLGRLSSDAMDTAIYSYSTSGGTQYWKKSDGSTTASGLTGAYVSYSTSENLSTTLGTVAGNFSSGGSETPIGATASITDAFNSGNFLRSGDIKLYKVKCTGATGSGESKTYNFEAPGSSNIYTGSTPSVSGNTISVTGFDYDANKVSGSTATDGQGYKLVMQYPMTVAGTATIPGSLTTLDSSDANSIGMFFNSSRIATFTSPSVEVRRIDVQITGLKKRESATFNVYRQDGSNWVFVARLIATGPADDSTGPASVSCFVPETGTYKVEESGWNWPYSLATPSGGGRSIVQTITDDLTATFSFQNGPSATSPNHNEHISAVTLR